MAMQNEHNRVLEKSTFRLLTLRLPSQQNAWVTSVSDICGLSTSESMSVESAVRAMEKVGSPFY